MQKERQRVRKGEVCQGRKRGVPGVKRVKPVVSQRLISSRARRGKEVSEREQACDEAGVSTHLYARRAASRRPNKIRA